MNCSPKFFVKKRGIAMSGWNSMKNAEKEEVMEEENILGNDTQPAKG